MLINPTITDWNKLLNNLNLDPQNLESDNSIAVLGKWCEENIQSDFSRKNLENLSDPSKKLKNIRDLFDAYSKLNARASVGEIVDLQLGSTVIHQAAKLGFDKFIDNCLKNCDEEAVKKILRLKTTSNGNTPLHLAALQGNAATVNLLLDNEADANVVNKQNKLPLYLAATKNNGDKNQTAEKIACIKALLAATKGENLLILDDTNSFLLEKLISFANLELVKETLAKNPQQRHLKNSRGENVLHLAILQNNHDLVNFFITYKELASENTANSSTGLHLACRYGDEKIITQLYHKTKSLDLPFNSKDHSGYTPYDYLKERRDLDNLPELIDISEHLAQLSTSAPTNTKL